MHETLSNMWFVVFVLLVAAVQLIGICIDELFNNYLIRKEERDYAEERN